MRYLLCCRKKKLLNPRNFFKHRVLYSMKFSSLLSPGTIKNFRLFMRSLSPAHNYKNNQTGSSGSKILIKQSYVLLVWFFHLTSLHNTKAASKDKVIIPGFFIYPKKVTKFTILKAPMAHKTFSQEQISFSSYSFSLTLFLELQSPTAPSKDAATGLLDYFGGLSLFYGTNMLFLKNFRVIFLIKDSHFFSYYGFLRQTILRSSQ